MNAFWELLFLAWCPSYSEDMIPDHLKNDPIRGYGECTFREGGCLGLTLATLSFQRWWEEE